MPYSLRHQQLSPVTTIDNLIRLRLRFLRLRRPVEPPSPPGLGVSRTRPRRTATCLLVRPSRARAPGAACAGSRSGVHSVVEASWTQPSFCRGRPRCSGRKTRRPQCGSGRRPVRRPSRQRRCARRPRRAHRPGPGPSSEDEATDSPTACAADPRDHRPTVRRLSSRGLERDRIQGSANLRASAQAAQKIRIREQAHQYAVGQRVALEAPRPRPGCDPALWRGRSPQHRAPRRAPRCWPERQPRRRRRTSSSATRPSGRFTAAQVERERIRRPKVPTAPTTAVRWGQDQHLPALVPTPAPPVPGGRRRMLWPTPRGGKCEYPLRPGGAFGGDVTVVLAVLGMDDCGGHRQRDLLPPGAVGVLSAGVETAVGDTAPGEGDGHTRSRFFEHAFDSSGEMAGSSTGQVGGEVRQRADLSRSGPGRGAQVMVGPAGTTPPTTSLYSAADGQHDAIGSVCRITPGRGSNIRVIRRISCG